MALILYVKRDDSERSTIVKLDKMATIGDLLDELGEHKYKQEYMLISIAEETISCEDTSIYLSDIEIYQEMTIEIRFDMDAFIEHLNNTWVMCPRRGESFRYDSPTNKILFYMFLAEEDANREVSMNEYFMSIEGHIAFVEELIILVELGSVDIDYSDEEFVSFIDKFLEEPEITIEWIKYLSEHSVPIKDSNIAKLNSLLEKINGD